MVRFWTPFIVVLLYSTIPAGTVSLDRLSELTRDQLLDLDREVSQYYNESYGDLDEGENPISYDEQLFRSIRSLRHTVVMHIFDYKYSRNETKWNSMGSRVNKELCRKQLRLLAQIANKTQALQYDGGIPLSVMDFLEASGNSGSGVLNGNFVWLGSYNSCLKSRIPATVWRRYLNIDTNEYQQVSDIEGRYCVAHLRAKSWPKWDDYFEDRLTLKRGICLPDACHTAIIESDPEMGQLIDFLARVNLAHPFGGDRYETSELYCLPDEDSPFRQMDLGAKMFIVFVVSWLLFTIYMNVKYYKRVNAMQKLRDTVDIKMIINEKLDDIACNYRRKDDASDDEKVPKQMGPPKKKAEMDQLTLITKLMDDNQTSDVSSAASSVVSTPLPSGIDDDDDSDTIRGLINPFVMRKRKKKRSSKVNVNYNYAGEQQRAAEQRPETGKPPSDSLDLVRAFAFEANLGSLLKPRQSNQGGSPRQQRSEASNPADETEPDVERRVDIDILDGMKVIATSWIVWGHTMMFFFGLVVDLRFGTERMLDITMLSTINTLQVVGLFYIITGCLLTYFSFNRAKAKQLLRPIFWLLVLVSRYIRLIPAYALVFWFARHVAPHTGSGPGFYEYRTDDEHARSACANESWWIMWTMSAADIKIPMDCIPQAWYLSDDFRTLLVLPVYVLLLAKSTLLGYSAIFATFAYSNFRMAQILRTAKIDYRVVLMWQPHVYSLMADRLHEVYTNAAVRMSTYLLGVIVGHLLYLYESRQIKNWPSWFRALGMKVALVLAACFFLGARIIASPMVNQFLPAREHIDSDSVVWLIPIFKSAMELSLCAVILLLVTGGGFRFIRMILTSQAMKILSNLSYVVFLTHIEIMYKLPGYQLDSDYWHLFKHALFFIVAAHVVAFFVHLLFEMPVHFITRSLIKRVANLLG